MKKPTDKEIADIAGFSKQAISYKKQNDYNQYEIIRLGAICKKFNLSEEELLKYIELKSLICSKNSKL